MKKFLKLLVFCCILFVAYGFFVRETERKRIQDVRNSLSSTAMVSTGDYIGTGIVLDTGYIFTAAHVIDVDGSHTVDAEERNTNLGFYGIANTTSGRVLYADFELDFAVIEPVEKRTFYVDVAPKDTEVGGKIYTVGATAGRTPNITTGYVTYSDKDASKASCAVYNGNSGGGVLNEKHQLVGIVKELGIKREMESLSISIPIPTKNGLMFVRGFTRRLKWKEINHICYFTSLRDIRASLRAKNLGQLLDKPREPTFYERHATEWNFALLRLGFNIFLGVLGWLYFRKHLG